MSFFKKEHKKLANNSFSFLQDKYHDSEDDLRDACKTGKKKLMRKAMKEHQKYEYALLYRKTPEFKALSQNKK